jgi:hypothetical protein
MNQRQTAIKLISYMTDKFIRTEQAVSRCDYPEHIKLFKLNTITVKDAYGIIDESLNIHRKSPA